MEMKLYILLAVFGLLSSALGKGGKYRHRDHDNDHNQGQCPMPESSSELPLTCSVTDDCSTITCSARVENKEGTLTMKIDKSKDPLIATIRLQVPDLKFDWSHEFKDGDKIDLKSFPLEVDGFRDVTITLQLSLKKLEMFGHTAVAYKLDMIAGEYGSEATVTILKGKVPLSGDGDREDHDKHGEGRWSRCRRKFSAWWNRQSIAVKTTIIISAVLVFLMMVTGVVYCCNKRRTVASDTLKVVPPSYHEATSTDTKVPLEPLVNEE